MSVKVKRGADGVFECRLYLGRAADGKAIRPYKRFPNAATEDEAQALAETWAANLTADGTVRSARLTDLLEDYVQMRERNGASPNSVRSYRLFICYVERYLKTANARDLSVMDFNRFEQRLLMSKDEGGQGLCRNSVNAVHNFLRGAYNHFVDAGVCGSNPMFHVSKPRVEHHEASAISEWDFAAFHDFIEAAMSGEIETKEDYRKALIAFVAWLALVTGVRVGEACAIRRADVKRSRLYIHVGGNVIEEKGRKPYRVDVTKGRASRNVSVTEEDIRVIDAFTRAQDAILGRLGANAPLVTLDGSFVRPGSVSRAFRRICDACGLPKEIKFHSLRHTHATWLLSNGCDLKTLSLRLGHADEATTIRHYGHEVAGNDARAAQMFNKAMHKASE